MRDAFKNWTANFNQKKLFPNVIIPYLEENYPQLEIEFDIVTVFICNLNSLEDLDGGKDLMEDWRERTQGYDIILYHLTLIIRNVF